uniref:Uncharacterized protein n=1 Tax=uncultured marine virus TaxID=186617 RepID=A0A0F7L7S3_9VIRU|nr:hypothetical protein [uncultured marine virus]
MTATASQSHPCCAAISSNTSRSSHKQAADPMTTATLSSYIYFPLIRRSTNHHVTAISVRNKTCKTIFSCSTEPVM